MLDYVSGYDGSTVQLGDGLMHVGEAVDVRSRQWSYTLGRNCIAGAMRAAREVAADLTCIGLEQLDRARHIFDRDVQTGAVGELVYAGEWRTRALVVAQSPSEVRHDLVTAALTIVLMDGIWRRMHEMHVPMPSTVSGGGGLDYPYDYPYDYARPEPPKSVKASEWCESAVGLRIYGPATNPAVTIGSNTYQIMREVADTERIEVDGLHRTLELVTLYGHRINVAADAVRGRGAGGGSYIFQPLPPGESPVTSDGSFAFDLIWYDEEGEPPWSLS